jgi:hypothetical protein
MTDVKYAIVTAADSKYFYSLVSLLESLLRSNNNERSTYVYDLGLQLWQREFLNEVLPANFICLNLPKDEELFTGWNDPRNKDHYAWKPAAISNSINGHRGIFWIDAGVVVTSNLTDLEHGIDIEGALLVKNENHLNLDWTSSFCANEMNVSRRELDSPQIMGNFFGMSLIHPSGKKLMSDWVTWCRIENVVKGDRKSHRHDQTVLSILAARNELTLLNDSTFTGIGRFGKDFRQLANKGLVYIAHRRWLYLFPIELLKGKYRHLFLYTIRSIPEILRILRLRTIYRGRQTYAGEVYVMLRRYARSPGKSLHGRVFEGVRRWKK